MGNLQTERNRIINELLKLTEHPEQIKFLMELSTDVQVDLVERNKELKKELEVLKRNRDWMFNKILERVNKN